MFTYNRIFSTAKQRSGREKGDEEKHKRLKIIEKWPQFAARVVRVREAAAVANASGRKAIELSVIDYLIFIFSPLLKQQIIERKL